MPFMLKAGPVMNNPTDGAQRSSNTASTGEGAWVSKIASCPVEADGFVLASAWQNPQGHFKFDVGIGPSGSQVVIADGVYYEPLDWGFGSTRSIFIPVRIPKGEQVWMRAEGNQTGDVLSAGITVMSNMGYPPGQYAFMESNGGNGLIQHTGTAGAIIEITPALLYKYKYIIPYFSSNGGGLSNQNVDYEFLVGPSGSEIVWWKHHAMNDSRVEQVTATPFPILACPFDKGARLSIRATTGGTARRMGIIGVV